MVRLGNHTYGSEIRTRAKNEKLNAFGIYTDTDAGRAFNSPRYANRIATAMHVPTIPTGEKLLTESTNNPSSGARIIVASDFDCASMDKIVALISGVDCALKRLISPGRQKFWRIANPTKSPIIAGCQLNHNGGINNLFTTE